LIETNFFSTNGIQIGSALEMLLLALALADQYNVIQREKELAQQAALQAQQLLVDSLQSSEKLLETRVAARTEELRLLNAKLEVLSATDAMTGLANRRRFDEVLNSEWRRAQRAGQPIAVGLLDVDWFKKYNDRYGHLAGDECLRHVAQVLAAGMGRAGDLAARYGGEEFAFIALGADGESALAMARKICDSLAASGWRHEASEFGIVTASGGVACFVPDDDSSPQALMKAADEALYLAKAQGRNKVVLHRPEAAH
jgi:diguanylate cyclase (GGDEF)-like protein